MKNRIAKQKLMALFLLLLTVLQVMHAPMAAAMSFYGVQGFNDPIGETPKTSEAITHYGLIAVMVEDGLMNNATSYDGLINKQIGTGNDTISSKYPTALTAKTLAERIRRYALDAQRVRPFTKSIIIKVKKNEKVENIADALERLYQEGEGKKVGVGNVSIGGVQIPLSNLTGGEGETSQLQGVVIIGDVPLPVLNKGGNRYVSLLPYTDFKEKAYVFDQASKDFVPNTNSNSSQPEVWSGIIKPPLSGDEGSKLLAEYFDKNYLFHCSTNNCKAPAAMYKQFSRKILFADLVNEFKQMNKAGFANYLRYLNYWEDITYERWSKFLAQKFVQDSVSDSNINDPNDPVQVEQPNDYDPDKDGINKKDPKDETAGPYKDGKQVPDGCPGVCGVDEDSDSVDQDQDGYPDGYEREIGSDVSCLANGFIVSPTKLAQMIAKYGATEGKKRALASDPTDKDSKPMDCKLLLPIPRLSPSPNASWWIDEGSAYNDRPYNFTKNGTNCSGSNTNTANCVGNPADDDEDGTVDEEADADQHPNDNQNHFSADIDPKNFEKFPDISARELIMQLAQQFNQLFDKYLGNISDWVGYTGRYRTAYTDAGGNAKSDVSTMPGLVTMKDEYTRKYLRAVGDAIENRIDYLVQKRIDPNNPFAVPYSSPQHPGNQYYNALQPFIDPGKKYLDKDIPMLKGALLQLQLKLKQGMPLDTFNGDAVEFVNFSQNQGEFYLYGTNTSGMKTVADCSLYRGSQGPDGSNSSMIIASTLYDISKVIDQNIVGQYAGCIGQNMMHPEYCFADVATQPLFDLLGTKKVTGVDSSNVDYRACFDMKEKAGYQDYVNQSTAYLQKLETPDYKGNEPARAELQKPRSPYTPADQVLIFNKDVTYSNLDKQNVKISLSQLLDVFGGFDGKDNNSNGQIDEFAEANPLLYGIASTDYKKIGSELLQKAATYQILNNWPNAENKLLTVLTSISNAHKQDIDKVTLTVTPLPALVNGQQLSLSSYQSHREPTKDTLSKQRNAKLPPESLPIDNPRYFTFMDNKGNAVMINYPNLFAAHSYNELIQILKQTEDKLNKVAVDNGIAINFTGQLTSMIKGKDDMYSGGKPNGIILASSAKIAEAYTWKEMNIDEKHQHVLEMYLDPKKDAFIGESSQGYESLYLVASGSPDRIMMNFNGDIPEKDSDPKLEAIANQPALSATEPSTIPGQSGGSENGGGSTSSENDFVDLLKWFGTVTQWLVDIATLSGGDYKSAPACGAADELKQEAESQQNKAPDFGSNDFLNMQVVKDSAKETSKLRISADKQVVKTASGDAVTVIVEGLGGNGQVNTADSMTKVQLKLTKVEGDKVFTLNPDGMMTLSGGKASFQMLPGENEGSVKVKAVAPERTDVGASNEIAVTSTGKSVRIDTYKLVTNPLVYSKTPSGGFIILEPGSSEDDQKIVADVNGTTGMVTIRPAYASSYELVTLPSMSGKPAEGETAKTSAKPARLGVKEISSGSIVASVYFVTDGKTAVTIDQNVDYFASAASLSGTHVKDRNESDLYLVQSAIQSSAEGGTEESSAGASEVKSKVYLVKRIELGGKLYDSRLGIVDAAGNIFLRPELTMGLKQPLSSSSPVVFEIRDSNGNSLFEVYIAAKYPKIEIIKEEGDYKDFNLAAVMKRLYARGIIPGMRLIPGIVFVAHAAAPIIPDTDKDGLNDLEELILHLNYKNADTDGDNFEDGDEILNNFNPAKPKEVLFKDLKTASKGFDDIIRIFKRGIVSGYADGTFRPQNNLSREEFVKMDLGAVCIDCTKFNSTIKKGLDLYFLATPFFPDKNITPELNYCVKKAKFDNIVSGYKGGDKAGFFLPANSISRAEATKVIIETVNRESGNKVPVTESVNDAGGKSSLPWYYNYVLAAQKQKLYPTGYFQELDQLAPDKFKTWFDAQIKLGQNSTFIKWVTGNITRAEFATMVSKMVDIYDCFSQDSDGDGIPDNFEKYIYGTNPKAADSDGGGVSDFDELLNGTNPLDAKDDKAVKVKEDDNDGMPADWEIQHGLDPYNAADANEDPDGDGLTNLDEFKYGTDPFVADTDGGGVNDGDEVIHGTDPLYAPDDLSQYSGTEGGYIVGNSVFENYISMLSEPVSGTSNQQIEFTNEMPADGKSSLFVKASVVDADGNILTDDSQSVIDLSASANAEGSTAKIPVAKLDPSQLTVKEGVALTRILASKAAGTYALSASVKGKSIPAGSGNVYVMPQEPSIIRIKADSPIIKTGGLSTTNVIAELLDVNGNLCDTQMYQVSFYIGNGGTALNATDEDPNKDGIQISSVSGKYLLTITSTDQADVIDIFASYNPSAADETENETTQQGANITPPDLLSQLSGTAFEFAKDAFQGIYAKTSVQSRDDLKIVLKPQQDSLPSDYASFTKVTLEVQDGNGNVVSGFQGNASFKLTNDQYGRFIGGSEPKILNGKASVLFGSANLAGDATINATVTGFDATTTTVKMLPKDAKQLKLESDCDECEANPQNSIEVRAKLYDTDNNFVDNDSATAVTLSLTADSKKFAAIDGAAAVKAVNGVATFKIKTKDLTGPINLIAESNGLLASSLSLTTFKKFDATSLKEIGSHTLYASLLGTDFGNVFKENYLAGWFVFSGEAQAATTLISPPSPNAHLVEVAANGKITLVDTTNYDSRVIPSNGTNYPNRITVYDVVGQKDLAEVAIRMPSASRAVAVDDQNPLNKDVSGVYVEMIDSSADYSLVKKAGAVSLTKNGNEVVRIFDNGNIKILNNLFSLSFASEAKDEFTKLTLIENAKDVASISFVMVPNTDVQLVPNESVLDNSKTAQAGVYLRIISEKRNIGWDVVFSGNSSAMPKGITITDKDNKLPANQAPGQNYESLEKAGDTEGIGFVGENKHMLLWSAGNTAGESNLPYASEIGVVIGDPTVRLDEKKTLTAADFSKDYVFTKDIGQEIFMGSETIQEILPIDYNSDGLKDLLVAYKKGEVRLMQNNNAYPRFQDRGVFLNFANGIISMASADLDKDGQEDLVVATNDSCRQGEICVDAFMNNGGNFVRKNLNLKSFTDKNRVYMIKTADMNNDSYPEIITSDDSGTVRVFWNFKGNIDPNGTIAGSLAMHIDQNANLKSEVLVYYNGVPGAPVNSADTTDDANFKQINVPVEQQAGADADAAAAAASAAYEEQAAGATPALSTPKSQNSLDFIYLDLDQNLGIKSAKTAKDATPPLDTVGREDQIDYSIKLTNSSGSNISNLMVSDIISSSVTLDKSSIKCADCDQPIQLKETGQSTRPLVFAGINIPAGKSRTINYSVKVNNTPMVQILLGHSFDTGYKDDNYLDIGATPVGNPTGRMTYFYSFKANPELLNPSKVRIEYRQYTTPPPAPVDPSTDPSAVDFGAMANEMKVDANNDGIPDKIADIQSSLNQQQTEEDDSGKDALDQLGDDIENTINKFTCKGGCLPLPINFAFLAPGQINAAGIVVGQDFGLPVFGVTSSFPFVWPPSPYQGSVFRFYLSPTLTGRLGMGICMGPWLGGFCFAFATELPGFPDSLCDKITGSINSALAKAKKAATSAANYAKKGASKIGVSSDSSSANAADASGRVETGGFTSSANLGNYHPRMTIGTNFRIPGFPAVITSWLDRQTEEIITKLTDLPDIFVFLPNPLSIVGAVLPQDGQPDPNPSISSIGKQLEASAQKMSWNPKSWLKFLNAIPILQVVPKDVLFKIPAITEKEIKKFQYDAQQWLIDERHEINRTLREWSCDYLGQYDETLPYNEWKFMGAKVKDQTKYDQSSATACEKLLVDMTNLRQSIEKNIEVLNKWKELPRQLLDMRRVWYKYLQQIICYFDTVIRYAGGYVVQQQKRVEAYIEAFRKILQQIKDFKLIIDLMIDYNASCDKCSTSRFSLFELLLRLFLVIPSPPIIPFPKWPDLYVDMSKIQAGVKIIWPDIRFRPEPMILPKIPRIYLPTLPTLTVKLPAIPVLPEPPTIPLKMPDLPPLQLPSLPNLPPPPKLPNIFPVSLKKAINILKKILRILCLLRKGLIPVPETGLKSQIEQMTERGLSMLLPIDLGLNVQYPPVSLDLGIPTKIEVLGIFNLPKTFEADQIYNFVKDLADKANSFTTDWVEWLNQKTKELEEKANQAAETTNNQTDVGTSGNESIDLSYVKTPQEAIKTIAAYQPQLGELSKEWDDVVKELEKTAAEYEEYNKKVSDYHLEATQQLLAYDDPLLNRPLSEVKAGVGENSDVSTDFQKQMVQMRTALIAYAEASDNLDTMLSKTTDLSETGKILAASPSIQNYLGKVSDYDKTSSLFASTKPVENSAQSEVSKKISGNNTEDPYSSSYKEAGETMKSQIKSKLRLLADYTVPDVPGTPGMSNVSSAQMIGMFIYDSASGTSERIIDNVAEADKPNQMILADIDNDGNEDLVYAYGGNVYYKQNYKPPTQANLKNYLKWAPEYTGTLPKETSLNEYVPQGPAINGLTAAYNNNKNVQLSWDQAGQQDISGYEIDYMTAPDAFDQDLNVPTHKVGMAINAADQEQDTPADASFAPAKLEVPYYKAENVNGTVTFDGTERIIVKGGDAPAQVTPQLSIHTLQDSELVFGYEGESIGSIKLPANRRIIIPDTYQNAVELQLVSGAAEIINPAKTVKGQALVNGMQIDENTVLVSAAGAGATVRFGDGAYVSVNNGEDLLIKSVNSPESPSAQLNVPNGFYYAKIYSFNKYGFRSTVSNFSLMAPTVCADKQVPVLNAGPTERSVSIFKKLTIDASKSFDAGGNITTYYLDTDPTTDSDGNGDPTDDKNMANDRDKNTDSNGDGIPFNDMDDPVFTLGPYGDLQPRKVVLNIFDESNNHVAQEINISIYVPQPSLDTSTSTSGVISGNIDPAESEIPITLIRNRNGEIKKIITQKAIKDGKYYTDENGGFKADDLNLKDTIVIKNAKGEIIGEINPETGMIVLYDNNYHLEVLPAEKPLLPTRIVVKDKDNQIITTIFLVPDVNTDTVIDPLGTSYNNDVIKDFKGVHSVDMDGLDDFEWSKLPMDDPVFPGATVVTEKSTMKRLAVLDSGGNFYVIDKRISLKLRDGNKLSDPLIIQIVLTLEGGGNGTVIGEFYTAVAAGKGIKFLSPDEFNPLKQQSKGSDPLFDSDHDGIPDWWELTYGLNPKDPSDALKDNDGDGLTNLQEYKLNSNPLNPDSNGNGINDAQELIYGRNPTDKVVSPFTDVTEKHPYYASIMNLFQRNILKGIPRGRGIAFGPDEAFTRAEFAKMMLDIFCIVPRSDAYKAPAPFKDMPYIAGKMAWYWPYVKEAYFQGFVTGYLGELDPKTGLTPFKPDNTISKAEVVKVILEALQRNQVIDYGKVAASTPWYTTYMQIAQDLKPYLKNKSRLRQVYIITAEEAKNPEAPITRAEFVAMADRVLTAYDCSVIDDDGDGMPSYWERLHGLNPKDPSDANDDPDKDGLTNLQEYLHGTDPFVFDTDHGGVSDGQEVKFDGTNPLNPKDDLLDDDHDGMPSDWEKSHKLNPYDAKDANQDPDGDGLLNKDEYKHNTDPHNPDTDGDGLTDGAEVNKYNTDPTNPDTDSGGINDGAEVGRGTDPLNPNDDLTDLKSELGEGIYVVPPECNSCPCAATIDHTADIIPGDIVSAIISSSDDKEIFAESNKVLITEVPKP